MGSMGVFVRTAARSVAVTVRQKGSPSFGHGTHGAEYVSSNEAQTEAGVGMMSVVTSG